MLTSTVSPMSLVKNPMILLAIVALGFTLGVPKLMENSAFPRFPFPTVTNRWQWTLRCAPSLSSTPDRPLSQVPQATQWLAVVSIWPGGWLAPHPVLPPMPTRLAEIRQVGIRALLGGEASRFDHMFECCRMNCAVRDFSPNQVLYYSMSILPVLESSCSIHPS